MVLEPRPRFLAALFVVVATMACGSDSGETESSADASASADADSTSDSSGTGAEATCETVCPAVLEAACSGGPVDMARR